MGTSCLDCPLRQKSGFKRFSTAELAFVTRLRTTQRSVAARTTLIAPGEASQGLYTLFSGWAFRYRLTPDGQRQILDILLPGDLIGLQAFMLGCSDSGVETLTPAVLCVLAGGPIDQVFADHPSLARSLVRTMVESERRVDIRLSLLGRRSATERLAYFLLELFDRLVPLGLADNGWCHLPLQRRHLADLLGLSETHVSRSMADLRGRKLADIEAGALAILDRPSLMAVAGYAKLSTSDPCLLL